MRRPCVPALHRWGFRSRLRLRKSAKAVLRQPNSASKRPPKFPGPAIGLALLNVERFTSRSVPTGSGMVKCAHGMMPIPAPGTAELLKGVPLASSSIKAELTTPTGAAILTTVVTEWVEQPVMTVERIGHGAGRKEFADQPNLLRLFVGTRPQSG